MNNEDGFEMNGLVANPFEPLGHSSENTIQALRSSGHPRSKRERAESLLDSLGSQAARDLMDIDE